MKHQAYIAGCGIITSIGTDTATNLASLKAGQAGITQAAFLETRHTLPVGEIKLDNAALAARCGVAPTLPRTALLSIAAAQEAWLPLAPKAGGLRIALISANTVGGMDLTEHFYADFKEDPAAGENDQVRYHECGAITELTAKALGLDCWCTTISTACSSSANSIMTGARLIEKDRYDLVIAGGADSLSRFTLNGFNSLMILDKELCRPFDRDRKGLNLGEGAAYLVLAGPKAAAQLGIQPVAALTGYANANDAHHQTASSPEGKGNQLAMAQAITQAGISPDRISYINLHGTGTENNDASEGAAVQAIFGGKVPPASSTKAFTGHTLGAAGAVEAVYSLLAIQEQVCLPHLRMENPIEGLDWQPARTMQAMKIDHVLSNSFGFGGNCSSLVLSKV